MLKFQKLKKLNKGDKVAILSPSLAAPAIWPEVYKLGLDRIINDFGLVPVEYPTTKKLGATGKERSEDLIAAFLDPEIKAVIATLGGDDEITYIQNMPKDVFINNPKPFFGFSDTTHLQNFLWLVGVPSYYGGALFTQFAMQFEMDDFTVQWLKAAMFNQNGLANLKVISSLEYNDVDLDWFDQDTINQKRVLEPNNSLDWNGSIQGVGILWGGCLESIDEILRHSQQLPSLEDFKQIVLCLETSEEAPSASYVYRVLRALGCRGYLANIKGLIVGRPKVWNRQNISINYDQKQTYKQQQIQTITKVVREYNKDCPIVQNLDFGHTNPQICLPLGGLISIDPSVKELKFL
jgi:muramoyltetrapeptide carboxypeptidase LdcA involved in peptidoglycan recycling